MDSMRLVVLVVFVALGGCWSEPTRIEPTPPLQSGAGGAADAGGSAGAALGFGGSLGGSGEVAGSSGHGGASGSGGGAISGDGGPPPIPTDGLAVWLTADRGVVQSGGFVQRWLDQSGQGMDTIQTGSNFSPQLATNGGFGAVPTLDFDGIDDYLNFPSAGFGDFSKGLSWFVVLNPAAPECASIIELSNGTELQNISLGYYLKSWRYKSASDSILGNPEDPEPALLVVIHRPDQTIELRLDGRIIEQMSFGLPEQGVRTRNFLGKSLYGACATFQGHLAEILLYSRAVTDLELLRIEGYLQAHWACCQ